jgi:hypothetical protein
MYVSKRTKTSPLCQMSNGARSTSEVPPPLQTCVHSYIMCKRAPFICSVECFICERGPFTCDSAPFFSDGASFICDGECFCSGGGPFIWIGAAILSGVVPFRWVGACFKCNSVPFKWGSCIIGLSCDPPLLFPLRRDPSRHTPAQHQNKQPA